MLLQVIFLPVSFRVFIFTIKKMHVHLILICKTAVALNDPSLRCNMHQARPLKCLIFPGPNNLCHNMQCCEHYFNPSILALIIKYWCMSDIPLGDWFNPQNIRFSQLWYLTTLQPIHLHSTVANNNFSGCLQSQVVGQLFHWALQTKKHLNT